MNDLATNPAQPETYPRRILLAVTGLTPQVVTETLYYLARLRTVPLYLDSRLCKRQNPRLIAEREAGKSGVP
jgi:hypothetical protein